MSVDFCIRALEKTLEKGVPIYFNTDQGSQFTSTAFLEILKSHSIKISMDGVGRCIDNIYQERGWRALKYEKIYPGCYETVPCVMKAITSTAKDLIKHCYTQLLMKFFVVLHLNSQKGNIQGSKLKKLIEE